MKSGKIFLYFHLFLVNFYEFGERIYYGFCQITVPELFKLAWFISSWKVFVGTLQFVTVKSI